MHIHCKAGTLNHIILNIYKNTYRFDKINILIRAVGFLRALFQKLIQILK